MVGVGGLILRAQLWRALVFLRPESVRVEPVATPLEEVPPEPLLPLARALMERGFQPVGAHFEQPRLAPAAVGWDFASAEHGAFATLTLDRRAKPRLYLLSAAPPEGLVLTAGFPWPSRRLPGRWDVGSFASFPLDRLVAAHARRSAVFSSKGPLTREGRLAAARAWYAGPGRAELRQQNLHGLLWTLGTVGMVCASLLARL